jgi:S-adenosyl-L-methionine hydrolase (adenosine-forming)
MANIITLTTDFGLNDHYVGAMKGSILGINPKVHIVDVAHGVPSFDIEQGAYLIGSSFMTFPKGTIHVVVVDPGVGSERRPILLKTEHYYFIAPDNGVLSLVAERDGVRELYVLDKNEYFLDRVSPTFHGRDIFAPVAAHLSKGVAPKKLGTITKGFHGKALFEVFREDKKLVTSVIHIDHFGNATTGFTAEQFFRFVKAAPYEIRIGGEKFNCLFETYHEVSEGLSLALIGSSGFLEIATRQESFAAAHNLKVGDSVELILKSR